MNETPDQYRERTGRAPVGYYYDAGAGACKPRAVSARMARLLRAYQRHKAMAASTAGDGSVDGEVKESEGGGAQAVAVPAPEGVYSAGVSSATTVSTDSERYPIPVGGNIRRPRPQLLAVPSLEYDDEEEELFEWANGGGGEQLDHTLRGVPMLVPPPSVASPIGSGLPPLAAANNPYWLALWNLMNDCMIANARVTKGQAKATAEYVMSLLRWPNPSPLDGTPRQGAEFFLPKDGAVRGDGVSP